MCAGVHHPTRGGTRGGKDQFQWEDVKTDKDRECYLGHSLMAPVGRWQKGKDLTWYTKKSKNKEFEATLAAERAAIKAAEEDAMAAALGFKPAAVKAQKPLTKQEAAQVFRRGSQDDEEGREERLKGVGFSGGLSQRKRNDSSSNDLSAIFEHDGHSDVRGSVVSKPERVYQPDTAPTTTTRSERDKLRAKLKAYLEKKAKAKKKRKESSKESRRRKESSSSSSSSDGEWVEVPSSRRRDPQSSDSDSHQERTRKQHRKHDNGRVSRSHDVKEKSHDQGRACDRRKRSGRGRDSDSDSDHKQHRHSSSRKRTKYNK